MSYGQGERNSSGASICLKWREKSDEGYPLKSLRTLSAAVLLLLWFRSSPLKAKGSGW